MDFEKPVIIAGPCSAESREQVLRTAAALAGFGIRNFRAGLWKPRTKPGEFEGVGAEGIEWLLEVRKTYGMKLFTEIASAVHLDSVLKYDFDGLWLGARTVSDPFAVQSVADALKGCKVTILVKNPISPDVDLWCGAIERLYNAGITEIIAVHRGFTAYEKHMYRNNPIWAVPMEFKRRMPEIQMLCDPSHIGGRRDIIASICQQAIDLNYDGLFIESHCCPDKAMSDAAQQLLPSELCNVLSLLNPKSEKAELENIDIYRDRIDEIDCRILELLSERMEISSDIGKVKRKNGSTLFRNDRYSRMLKERESMGAKLGLSKEFVSQVMREIHAESIKCQWSQDDLE